MIAEPLSIMKETPNMLAACTTRLLQEHHIMADIIPKRDNPSLSSVASRL